MNHWKVILATMLIFGAGVVTGGLLVRHSERLQQRPTPTEAQSRPVGGAFAGGARVEFLRRAQRELDLTAGQREKIDQLIADSQERTRKLMEPVSPQLREEMRRTKEELRRILTPAQQARFDELDKRSDRARDPHRSQRPPGPKHSLNPTSPPASY